MSDFFFPFTVAMWWEMMGTKFEFREILYKKGLNDFFRSTDPFQETYTYNIWKA